MACNSITVQLPSAELADGTIIAAREIATPGLVDAPVQQELQCSRGAERFLTYRFVRDLAVSADGKELRQGDDFSFDPERGLLVSRETRTLSLKYVGIEQRYDLVVYDPALNGPRLIVGRGRPLDPEEYRPSPPPGCTPLFSIWCWRGDSEVIPLFEWDGLVRRDRKEAHRQWLAYCRDRLPRTLAKLRGGESIVLGGYGDSTTAIGNREPAQNVAPNGPERDRLGFFGRMPPDTRAMVAQSQDQFDRPRVEVGWNWRLKREFEARGNGTRYLNWGIAGTTTEAGASQKENGIYFHGSHPERLRAAAEADCDLMVVGFGANEIGASGVGERLRSILGAFMDAGAECLVLTPSAENAAFIDRPHRWEDTQDQVIRAAMDLGCAYVPLNVLFGLGAEGATGLSRKSHAAGNLSNHPGATEFNAIGDLVSLIFEPIGPAEAM
jgi:hypothetical protein